MFATKTGPDRGFRFRIIRFTVQGVVSLGYRFRLKGFISSGFTVQGLVILGYRFRLKGFISSGFKVQGLAFTFSSCNERKEMSLPSPWVSRVSKKLGV